MTIQKQGRKPVKKIYLFFTGSLNTLHSNQRLKGICSNHNPRFIRLCNEMTIKRRKQAFWKKMANGWSTDQIDSCAVRQTKAGCRQSGQYYYLSPPKSRDWRWREHCSWMEVHNLCIASFRLLFSQQRKEIFFYSSLTYCLLTHALSSPSKPSCEERKSQKKYIFFFRTLRW